MAFGTEKGGTGVEVHLKVGHGKNAKEIIAHSGYETDRKPREFRKLPEGWQLTPIQWHVDKHYAVRWRLERVPDSSLPTMTELPPAGPKVEPSLNPKISQFEGLTPPKDIGVPDWLKED